MIIIANKPAVVTQSFLEQIEKIIDAGIQAKVERIETARQAKIERMLQYETEKLKMLKRGKAAFDNRDMFMTRLRALPYTKFDCVLAVEKLWLVAKTKPIIINGKCEAGVYHIWMPVEYLLKGSIDGWHFIPERAPDTIDRHPHHRAWPTKNDEGNPLRFSPSTCFGGFNTSIRDIADEMDFVTLYSTLHTYLSRYDAHSPLISLGNIRWLN